MLLYWTGIHQPPNSTMRAPSFWCSSANGVRLRTAGACIGSRVEKAPDAVNAGLSRACRHVFGHWNCYFLSNGFGMLWKFSKSGQRLALYASALCLLVLAYFIGELVSQYPPRFVAESKLPWSSLGRIVVYGLFGVLASELVLLLVQPLRLSNEALEPQRQ